MKPKKILMVTSFYPPYHVGGACTHVYYLANELAQQGHEIHVLFSEDSYYLKRRATPDAYAYPNHANITLHKIRTPLGKLTPLSSYITGIIPYGSKIKEVFAQEFDLIHYHNVSLFGPRIFLFGKAKKIFTAHDHWLICPLNDFFSNGRLCTHCPTPLNCSLSLIRNKRPLQLWRFSGLLKDALKEISLIITPSKYLKGFYQRHGITNRMEVLPNFVPKPPAAIGGIDQSGYFFYAGMLEDLKGIRNLLAAFKDLPDKKLLIAGKGSLEKYLVDFIRENNCANITYLGFVSGEKIYSYYRNALAFVLPSLCPDNCPNTLLEAMSVGTPSIGSQSGGIPDIVSAIDSNLIVRYNDVGDLKKKIREFDPKDYSREHIQEVYSQQYSSQGYLSKYLHLLDSL